MGICKRDRSGRAVDVDAAAIDDRRRPRTVGKLPMNVAIGRRPRLFPDELAGLLVDPIVGHDAMASRVGSGSQCGMTGRRLRIRVSIAGVRVMRALFEEVAKAAFTETIQVAVGQVSAKLIDRDLKYELRRVGDLPGMAEVAVAVSVRAGVRERTSADHEENQNSRQEAIDSGFKADHMSFLR